MRHTFVEMLVNEAVKTLRIAMDQGRYIPNFRFVEYCGWDNQQYQKDYNLFKLYLGMGHNVYVAANKDFTRFCLVSKTQNNNEWSTDNIFNVENFPLELCERILGSILRMDLDAKTVQ